MNGRRAKLLRSIARSRAKKAPRLVGGWVKSTANGKERWDYKSVVHAAGTYRRIYQDLKRFLQGKSLPAGALF
jgi:hypothetical protein